MRLQNPELLGQFSVLGGGGGAFADGIPLLAETLQQILVRSTRNRLAAAAGFLAANPTTQFFEGRQWFLCQTDGEQF